MQIQRAYPRNNQVDMGNTDSGYHFPIPQLVLSAGTVKERGAQF
jgi:hypothetical protein